MAKCIHCSTRKGKRACPALNGEICSACCGEHRRLTIACPDDCVWLGGGQLSLAPAPGATRSDRIVAVREKAHAFLKRHKPVFTAAMDSYTLRGEIPVPEDAFAGLIGFAMYGYRDREAKRGIDRFRESEHRRLRSDELEVLAWLESARFRLLEVSEVQLDQGFTARDLLRDEEVFVQEKLGTHQLRRFDVLASWIMNIEGSHEVEGSTFFVPREALTMVLDEVRRCREEDSEEIEQYAPVAVHTEMGAYFESMGDEGPELRNTDGDPLVISAARYAVQDPDAVKRGLAGMADLDAHEDGSYTWIDREHNAQLNGPTLLGRIVLDARELRVETNSRERLEEGRELIEEALGAAVVHRADSFSDPRQAIDAAPRGMSPGAMDSPEIRAVLSQLIQSKIEGWVDESIPALAGKTPRQAAADPDTREKVIELLKGYENLMARQTPAPTVDFSVVWRELGLSDA